MLQNRRQANHMQNANTMSIKNMRQTSSPIISTTTATINTVSPTMNENFDLDFIHISMTPPSQHYLTIEDLKSTRNSCWLCGCNWLEDHVSLDCQECGGYALSRPCPNCDGKCKQIWHRNLSSTHDFHKAYWIGQCGLARSSNEGCNQNQGDQMVGHRVHHDIDDDDECDVGLMLIADDSIIAKDLVSQLQSTAVASTNTTSSQNSPIKASASSCCSSQPSSASSSDSESESSDLLNQHNRHDNHHLHRQNTTTPNPHHHHHHHHHHNGQQQHPQNARQHNLHHLHSHQFHRGRQHS